MWFAVEQELRLGFIVQYKNKNIIYMNAAHKHKYSIMQTDF